MYSLASCICTFHVCLIGDIYERLLTHIGRVVIFSFLHGIRELDFCSPSLPHVSSLPPAALSPGQPCRPPLPLVHLTPLEPWRLWTPSLPLPSSSPLRIDLRQIPRPGDLGAKAPKLQPMVTVLHLPLWEIRPPPAHQRHGSGQTH